MGRKQVLEIHCDRCGRTETRELPKVSEVKDGVEPILEVRYKGTTTKYDDLCNRCDNSCENYYKNMTLQNEKEEQEKEEQEKKDAESKPEPKKGIFGMGGSQG